MMGLGLRVNHEDEERQKNDASEERKNTHDCVLLKEPDAAEAFAARLRICCHVLKVQPVLARRCS